MPNKKWNKKGDVKVDGKKTGVVIVDGKGNEKTLLNPHGKGTKFATELKYGVHLTNDSEIKVDKQGNYIGLTDTEASYRSGYLDCLKDSAKAYNAKNGGKR